MLLSRANHKMPISLKGVTRLDQSRLNIKNRSRTSRLPWRGQFSPEFVDYIIDIVCPNSTSFLDPFCGSGTVLYEAVEKNKSAYGLEVNPAAWHLASLASFGSLPKDEKFYVLRQLERLAVAISKMRSKPDFSNIMHLYIVEEEHQLTKQAYACVVLLGMGNGVVLSQNALVRSVSGIISLLNGMTDVTAHAECILGDARRIPYQAGSVEAVITSPPYINVFNYHQNYRCATELLGWQPLEAARTEIGSNRKHRANRFLTVIQYCMDMALCLAEMARVLTPNAPLIIVLGRTSNVLGASFENGTIIKTLIEANSGFSLVQSAERMFISRFGEQIYEDIFIATRKASFTPSIETARSIGVKALEKALANVPEKNEIVLREAILNAEIVKPSPSLSLSIPPTFLLEETVVRLSNASC